LLEGALGDALEQLGVVVEQGDMAPGDLIRSETEVVVAEGWIRASIVSISAFLATKAASAASFDLGLVL
jgi:hypothetical protein